MGVRFTNEQREKLSELIPVLRVRNATQVIHAAVAELYDSHFGASFVGPKHRPRLQKIKFKEGDPAPFVAGDLVLLKSGGPKMTVLSHAYAKDEVRCSWFHEGRIETCGFPAAALEAAKDKGEPHAIASDRGCAVDGLHSG